jgi:hypothetical protein
VSADEIQRQLEREVTTENAVADELAAIQQRFHPSRRVNLQQNLELNILTAGRRMRLMRSSKEEELMRERREKWKSLKIINRRSTLQTTLLQNGDTPLLSGRMCKVG